MPTCPSCGSSDAFQISPNYFRCMGMVPPFSDADPGEYVRCSHEYQAGGAVMTSQQPVCDCGTFAVGRCHTCERWVCGEHSAIFENRRLCQDHHHQALAPAREREAKAREKQEAVWRRQEEEREENRRRQEEEQKRQGRRRDRADAVQVAILIAMPVIAYLYFDGEGVSKALNLVLTGAVAGFLAMAGRAAYTSYSHEGRSEQHFVWEADSFWLGILGIPLGAAAGGILALVI